MEVTILVNGEIKIINSPVIPRAGEYVLIEKGCLAQVTNVKYDFEVNEVFVYCQRER